MYPTINCDVSGHLCPSGHFDRMQPATRLCGTLTRKASLLFYFLVERRLTLFTSLQSTMKIKYILTIILMFHFY